MANFTLTCGDFNVRCGTRAPRVGEVQLQRQSADPKECLRASWFIQLCEEVEQHVLNGAAPQPPAQHTYHGTRGQSCVDYILSRDPRQIITYDDTTLQHLSDHTVLLTYLPVAL